MPSTGVLAERETRFTHLIGNLHFDLPSEFPPKITANTNPVFPRDVGEGDSQSSSGSVKKSGGQSNSFEFFASRSFFSSAAVAL